MATDSQRGKSGVSPVAAGILGAAVGVAAATLAKEENRKKVGRFIEEAKTKGESFKQQASKTLSDMRSEVEKAQGNKTNSNGKTVKSRSTSMSKKR